MSNLTESIQNIDLLNVQEYWNVLENIIINSVDKNAPIKVITNGSSKKIENLPLQIKNKINERQRLSKLSKLSPVLIETQKSETK